MQDTLNIYIYIYYRYVDMLDNSYIWYFFLLLKKIKWKLLPFFCLTVTDFLPRDWQCMLFLKMRWNIADGFNLKMKFLITNTFQYDTVTALSNWSCYLIYVHLNKQIVCLYCARFYHTSAKNYRPENKKNKIKINTQLKAWGIDVL